MGRLLGADGLSAKGFIDALHAQADAEYGYSGVERFDEGRGDTGMGRIFWAGTDQDVVRRDLLNLLKRYLVASVYRDLQVIAHEHLNKIVGERVIVIDY